MKKLLIQSDDFGMTYGVVDGTIHAIKHGLLKNTGLFVNMKCSDYAAQRIKEVDVCLGIDINLLAGNPVSNPSLVPHLVNPNGHFRSSRQLLKENVLIKTEKYIYHFEKDPFNYEETLLETENQVKRFIELIGKKPEYINSHSISTPNSEKALYAVAEKYGIEKRCSDLYYNPEICIDIAYENIDYTPMDVMDVLQFDYNKYAIENVLPRIVDGKLALFVVHCGYIDWNLFGETSHTVQRMKDVDFLCSKELKTYIEKNNIELISYRNM